MSSEDMGLVQVQRLENGLNSHHHHRHHLVFQNDEALCFSCSGPVGAATVLVTQLRVGGVGDSGGVPKTRDLSSFIEERFFATLQTNFRCGIFAGKRADLRKWSANGAAAAAAAATPTPSVDGSEEVDDEEFTKL